MKLPPKDMVNPDHYKDANFEAIDVIEVATKEAPDGFIGMLHGNSLKYLYRLWRKENALQDAKKSLWYLNRLIEQLELLQEFEYEHNPEVYPTQQQLDMLDYLDSADELDKLRGRKPRAK